MIFYVFKTPVKQVIFIRLTNLSLFKNFVNISKNVKIINMAWFFIILIPILILLFSCAFAGVSFAVWVPCWNKDLKRIFRLADLKSGETFYDLGCGDGKTVVYAGSNFKVKAIGIELALPLYAVCKLRQLFNLNKNIKFKWKNLFNENLASADVVYFFGTPNPIKFKLKEKLERELKPGARVISYVFSVPGWKPAIVDKPKNNDAPIYLYIR
jgi:SAM-dependent methyltransferase